MDLDELIGRLKLCILAEIECSKGHAGYTKRKTKEIWDSFIKDIKEKAILVRIVE